MAIPNNTPNADTARKSATRSASKKDDKPRKDWWDKADIVGKWVVAVVIALVGWWIQNVVTTQNTGKDYMQMALNILEKKDLTQEMQKNIGLRKWAVGLLKYYSPVTLDDDTGDKLVSGEVEIPLVYSNSHERKPLAPYSTFNDWQEWGTPDPNSAFKATAPHGGFASLNTDGLLSVSTPLCKYTVHTEIKSPKGLFFSEGGETLIVYNNQTFTIFDTGVGQTFRGGTYFDPPKQISPPNGISNIGFSNDSTMIIVTGHDNKEIHYDLSGKEIK